MNSNAVSEGFRPLDAGAVVMALIGIAASLSHLILPSLYNDLYILLGMTILALAIAGAVQLSNACKTGYQGQDVETNDQMQFIASNAARKVSFILGLMVPLSQPSDWKTLRSLHFTKRVAACVAPAKARVWLVSGSVLFTIWPEPGVQTTGVFTRLLQGSYLALSSTVAVGSVLTWWSLTYFIFSLFNRWRR